jgi:hypothetical protein
MGTSVWLYIGKIASLEKDFRALSDSISLLRKSLNSAEIDRAQIKLELDLIIGQIRILKERTVCLKLMGERYDLAAMLQKLLLSLHALDPSICERAINELNELIESENP